MLMWAIRQEILSSYFYRLVGISIRFIGVFVVCCSISSAAFCKFKDEYNDSCLNYMLRFT